MEKQTTAQCGAYEVKFEGLEDGYRVTVKADPEQLRAKRRVMGAYVNFVKQADRAGFWLPLPLRWLLRFWARYSDPKCD